MKVWAPEGDLHRLEGLPSGVEAEAFPASGEPDTADEVRFVVPPLDLAAGKLEGMLSGLPELEVLQTTSAGVDWILPHVPSGVTLCDAAGVHDASVSEWVVGALLAMIRDFPRYRDLQRGGDWEHGVGGDLEGSTVLIAGHGSIGRALEERLAPFGVEILRVARSAREGVYAISDLAGLLPRADAAVVLVPLTAETRGLFGAELIGRMKEGAILVNAARGAVVDTDALVSALENRRIRAALDTTEPEPLPGDHPLWESPGAFITPHVAGDTGRFPDRAYRLVREQISRHAAGEPLINVVRDGY